jgi:quercetin dioxygenase-like cupin family protein
MVTIDLNNIELNEFIANDNPGQRCLAAFPMFGAHGTKKSATVYFELDPGEELGSHTDSEEEILLVLQGSVEVTIENEKANAGSGNMVLVTKMLPHNIKNTGSQKAKVLGFFGGNNNIVATFGYVWSPTQSNTVDTSALGS